FDFSCRKEAPRDFRVIGVRPDVFDIYPDIGVSGDGDEGQSGRVRQFEFQPAIEFGAEIRLAECVVDIAYSVRLAPKITPQEVTQHAMRGNKMLLIARESKACTSLAFV